MNFAAFHIHFVVWYCKTEDLNTFQESTDIENLAQMYIGWAAYMWNE